MRSIREIPEKTADFPKVCAVCKKSLTDKAEDVFAITMTRVTRMKYFGQELENGDTEWRGIVYEDFGFCSGINDTEETPSEFMCVSCYMKINAAMRRAAKIIFETSS